MGISDSTSPLAHSGFQSSWSVAPGQVSMADIVKMGRSHGKLSDTSAPPSAVVSHCDVHQSSKMLGINSVPEAPTRQHVHPQEEWPSIEQPPTLSVSSALDQKIDVPVEEDNTDNTSKENHLGSLSTSIISEQEENTDGTSLFDDSNFPRDMSSYQLHRYDHNEGAFLYCSSDQYFSFRKKIIAH